MKASLASANGASGGESFRLEIGNVSRRRAEGESGEVRRSYSIGSFEYLVDEDSEISMSHAHQWSVSDKEESGAFPETTEASLASEVGAGRSWLKEYVDRLSFSLSSRAMSFRSSGRFFSGSSRRSNITGAGELDLEANRVGEEISEMFRWLSGVWTVNTAFS
jgi:E3 ubiquitin-protein ligase ATL4